MKINSSHANFTTPIMKGEITMLSMQYIKSYLLSLNSIKYNYDMTEFNRRSDFVYKMCIHYGYLSYKQVIDIFEKC